MRAGGAALKTPMGFNVPLQPTGATWQRGLDHRLDSGPSRARAGAGAVPVRHSGGPEGRAGHTDERRPE